MVLKNVKETHSFMGRYEVIDPTFGNDCATIELDLGCGKGGFSMELAKRNPDTLVLAADIKKSRLRKINNKTAQHRVRNLETIHTMGWDLLAYLLPSDCLDRVHVICPDPWPKAKHSPNRMLSTEFIARLRRIMKPGAILHLATDDVSYMEWITKAMSDMKFFVPFDEGIDDIRDIKTEFEIHYEKVGKPVPHLSFKLEK